jgi:hypothetical protein
VPLRDPRLRMMDATLVSLLAYAGPRPESEALPLRWEQVGRRRSRSARPRAGGVERETRLLRPLARDLAEWRLRSFGSGPGDLVFPSAAGGQWSGDDWDNWRERIFYAGGDRRRLPRERDPARPARIVRVAADLGGQNVLQVAPQLGHSAQTCLDYYGREFEEFAGLEKRPAEDVIAEAREQVARGDVPTEYPAAHGRLGSDASGAVADPALSGGNGESPLPDSNRRPLPYHGGPHRPAPAKSPAPAANRTRRATTRYDPIRRAFVPTGYPAPATGASRERESDDNTRAGHMSIATHHFSADESAVAYTVCPRCGASRSGAALELESPFPGRCVPYATTYRRWCAGGRGVKALRHAVAACNHPEREPGLAAR